MSWRQKNHHDVTNTSWLQKHAMTSKTRHDVNKLVKNSSWRQKVRLDVKNTSWRQNVHKTRHNVKHFTMTSKIHHDVNFARLMISSSVITNSCLNGEIWSYEYKSPVRNYSQFVFCIVLRGIHQYKTVMHSIKITVSIIHSSKTQTKPHQNRGSDQVFTDQLSVCFNGGLNHSLDHCSKIGHYNLRNILIQKKYICSSMYYNIDFIPKTKK